jgi:hypothetical protein
LRAFIRVRNKWCEQFKQTTQRLHDERQRRNALTHSQYLFDFVEIGYPPLRSFRTKQPGDQLFSQEYLSKDVQIEFLSRLVELAVEVNFLHIQLVHDYKAAF